MNKRDMVRPNDIPPRGVLHARMVPGAPGYARYWPAEDLAPFVEHFWTVRWDRDEPETAEVLPHPSVHMVLEHGCSRVMGVVQGRFTRVLEGRGRVLGTKFRPGGFRPFLGEPVSALTDRVLELRAAFGNAADGLETRALAEEDAGRAFEVVEDFLRALRPVPDPTIELVARIAGRAAADRKITRVDQLASASGLGTRTLQRLFAEYVGVTPKWVIQRYRLHEAVERIAAGAPLEFAALAAELGYADQAHFIRDFRHLVGRSPAEYVKELRARGPAPQE